MTRSPRQPALLLIGPTGVGKTPLGTMAETEGYRGKRCRHFDFGASLRRVDATGAPVGHLYQADVTFIHKVLTEGALLENETFYIAAELLRDAIADANLGPDDYVLLNGLPRHVDQARDVDTLVRIERVLHLVCTPDTVYDRIRLDCGGDRAERTDDAPAAIAQKLKTFETRTRPLIDYYRSRHIPVVEVTVTTTSDPTAIWNVFCKSE